MEMIEQKQSYEFMRSVFERYHDLQTGLSILIQSYIAEVERKPASINQAMRDLLHDF